ncbi:MAG TPA: Crp/Fnr family transcriptional regulator [Ignavibacteria bacterium]|nr:Crp/Fnr family transcriptional regulator [Ignavibacteria bacterium]
MDLNTYDDNNCAECKKASKCFQFLIPDDLEFINSKKKQVTYLKGEQIFKQGAFAPYVLYVVEGLVKIFLQSGSIRQLNITLAKQGEFMAFTSVFDNDVYNYSAMALKDTTICMIDKSALRQLLLKNPDFALRITSRNCKNENRYLEIIKNISFKQMRGKLASTLLYLSDASPEENIYEYLTRQDIADFASITVESAVKFIKEFEKEGLLKLNGKEIEILERRKLMEIELRG